MDLLNLLQNSHLKITPQRLAILQSLEKNGHASIEELFNELKKDYPTISLATIYKNINALKNENIVSEICIHPKPKYEIKKEPHAHFICKKCLKIEDIDYKDLFSKCIDEKFPHSTKELYIYGICKDCQNDNS